MNLLNPAALWLLLLAAALLLLARNAAARPRRLVGNLYMWSRPASSTPAQLTWRRLRRHWLVILQAAIIAVIVTALARPLISWRTQPVALIVDVSSSMAARDGAGSRLDLARQAARAAIDALPRRSRVRLIVAGRSPSDLGEFSPRDSRLYQAIDGLAATAGAADIAKAVRAARALGIEAADITVFSDGRDAAVPDGDTRWITVGSPIGNQAITTIAARRLPATPNDGQVVTTIWNYAPTPVNREMELTQDDRVIARHAVHLEAQRHATIVTDVPRIGGVLRARLSTADALAADDQRITVVHDRRPARVLLITAGNFFLERALAANPGLSLEIATPGTVTADSEDRIVVCDRCPTVPAGARAVLTIPAALAQAPAPLTISRPDHPVARLLDTSGVRAAGASQPAPPAGSDIVLRAGADPALVAYESGGRRVVEMRIDVEAGGFPLSTAFPVLLDNVIAWLDARDEEAVTLLAGEPLQWRLPDPSASGNVSIAGPDGRQLRTDVNGAVLITADTEAAGLYEIRAGGRIERFAVNAVTDGESDLSARTDSLASTAPPPRTAADVTHVELTPFLLALTIALLALEWIARTRGTRAA